jgi:hypothetical protein
MSSSTLMFAVCTHWDHITSSMTSQYIGVVLQLYDFQVNAMTFISIYCCAYDIWGLPELCFVFFLLVILSTITALNGLFLNLSYSRISRRGKTKQKHNIICVGQHYAQTNTHIVNKIWALGIFIAQIDQPHNTI